MPVVKQLIDSGFYQTYATFWSTGPAVHKRFATFLDRTQLKIQAPAKTHFERVFRDKSPKITFGSRAGCECNIELAGGETITYYVKTNHDCRASNSSVRSDLDLKELFVYQLLDHLGIGANIEFRN
ncbi:Ubiquitin-like domain-containing protein [Aphelenchoides besseyi]|nr:Ubiquitin-like domain-containing protein [Aphelenchoides besseyi]